MKLETLIKPFSAMGDDEALLLIRSIRETRFTVRPVPIKKSTAKRGATTTTKKKAKEALAGMSAEDREEILSMLKGEASD